MSPLQTISRVIIHRVCDLYYILNNLPPRYLGEAEIFYIFSVADYNIFCTRKISIFSLFGSTCSTDISGLVEGLNV